MSFDNQTKLVSRMTSMWNFLLDESPEHITENVFKYYLIRKNPKKRKYRRESFTYDEIRLIFNHKTYLHAIFDNPTGRDNTIQCPYFLYRYLQFFWLSIRRTMTNES